MHGSDAILAHIIHDASPRTLIVDTPATLHRIQLLVPLSSTAVLLLTHPDHTIASSVLRWDHVSHVAEGVTEAELDTRIAASRANECCSVVYDGSDGVMLSHDNLTWLAGAVLLRDARPGGESVINVLPMHHLLAQVQCSIVQQCPPTLLLQLVDIALPVLCAGATWFLDKPPRDVRQ